MMPLDDVIWTTENENMPSCHLSAGDDGCGFTDLVRYHRAALR